MSLFWCVFAFVVAGMNLYAVLDERHSMTSRYGSAIMVVIALWIALMNLDKVVR